MQKLQVASAEETRSSGLLRACPPPSLWLLPSPGEKMMERQGEPYCAVQFKNLPLPGQGLSTPTLLSLLPAHRHQAEQHSVRSWGQTLRQPGGKCRGRSPLRSRTVRLRTPRASSHTRSRLHGGPEEDRVGCWKREALPLSLPPPQHPATRPPPHAGACCLQHPCPTEATSPPLQTQRTHHHPPLPKQCLPSWALS